MGVLAYILNASVVYLVGTFGVFGAKTPMELSKKYQTLVTPVAFAFSIWSVIYLSQLIFVVVQLLVKGFRSKEQVVKGVGYNYIGVCIAQAAWQMAFSFEIIWLSFILMLTIFYFLLKINVNLYKEVPQVQEEERKNSIIIIRDFWLLKFPFSIHCGWISAASFVNLNVLLVKYNAGAEVQYYVALASLASVFGIAMFNLYLLSRPQYVIPAVLTWASFGIYQELKDPNELIKSTFSNTMVSSVQDGAFYAMILILVGIAIRFLISVVKHVTENEVVEESVYQHLPDDEEE